MSHSDPAASRVASFDIFYTQFLDAEGMVRAPLPAFARNADELCRLYRVMLETRAFDKKTVALQRTGQLGTYASCLGQEAIGTAIGTALQAEDVYIPAYREYAAQFLRGVAMHEILLYWAGDERGSAWAAEPAHHDFPLSVPIATHMPHAIGVAYAIKLRREPRVVLASCGDGATSKGDFYEAISSARVWNLPIVFVVANNQWAISMPRERQTGAETLAQKGIAGGLMSEQVDGNDVIATRFVLERAIQRARSGHGPTLVEAITYRLHDHTTADDARRYRAEDEVRAAWERCPIRRLRRYLESQNLWSAEEEEALLASAGVQAENAARAFAGIAPLPPASIFDHLYAQLPAALQWQRDELRRAPPRDAGH